MFLELLVLLAALLCGLVAGLLFAFAVVVMPGLRSLDDAGFIRGFQAIDGVIQRGQALFMLMWVGSALAALGAGAMGAWGLEGVDLMLVIAAMLAYLLGVQVPTIVVNVPLNNRLQRLDVATLEEAALRQAREAVEPSWNRWNAIRTGCATLATFLFLLVLLRV